MNKRLLKLSTSSAIMAFATLQALPAAYAQTTPAAAEDDQRDVVVVTASRREENVQDTPLNIAAVGGAQIEEQGFTDIADVLAYVPGINVVDRGGRQGNPIIVRGLNADPIGSGDGDNSGGGTVATYLGEIPLFVDLKLNDMQRVEVLLGPQGTLYGAGTLGGAIRYIPNRPSFSGDTLSVRAEAYQYSEAESISTDAGFTFNKTVTDNFAIRGSLDLASDSGFVDQPYIVRQPGISDPDPNFASPAAVAANLRSVEDADSEDVLSGRLAARWAPLDWLDGTLTYYYQDADIGGRRISSDRGVLPNIGQYVNTKRFEEPNKIKNELLALEVTADLGFAELTSATGFSKYSDDGQRDQTDLLISLEYSYEAFPAFAAYTHEMGEEERFNEEIRLVSTTEGPLSWIVGAFYNESESVGFSAEYTPGYAAFAGFNRPDNLEYYSRSRINLVEQAIYGEVRYDITDSLTLTLGARAYKYDLREYTAVDFPLFDPSFVAPTLDEIGNEPFDPDAGQKDDGVLGKINLAWTVNSDLLLYATASQGYRIGNSNGLGQCAVPFDPLAPQTVCALAPGQQFGTGPNDFSVRDERQYTADKTNNYEIGAKSTWLDGDLVLNGAIYFIEWTDPQLSSATVSGSQPITVNAEGAESQGFEVSGNWQVTDQFSLRGNYSFTQAQLTAPVPDLIRTILPGGGFTPAFEDGQSGDRLPGSPENQFSLFGTYEQPFMDGVLLWNLGYAWQDDVLSRTGGRGSSLTLDAYGIANASVVYDAGTWRAALFANNLFDEFAETGVVGTSLNNQIVSGASVRSYYTTIAPPRAIGVRFSWDIQ